jgi:hypothetical protein
MPDGVKRSADRQWPGQSISRAQQVAGAEERYFDMVATDRLGSTPNRNTVGTVSARKAGIRNVQRTPMISSSGGAVW